MNRLLRHIILIALFAICSSETMAQVFVHRLPIYIVNGKRMSEEQVKRINPDDIADNTLLPADEESVAKYGQEASNGVILITLRYDTPARMMENNKEIQLADYIADKIKWESPANPVARVVIRLKIDPEGIAEVSDILESTDKRFLKKVSAVLAEMPRWEPAKKDGKGVASEYTLRLTLPRGMKLPRERSIPVIVGGL